MILGQYLNLLQKQSSLWHDTALKSGIVGAMLSNDIINILACPTCKDGLELIEAGTFLLCLSCGVKYPVRGDIPVLLEDEAVSADNHKISNKTP